jgi:DNA helicase II / ATP-dependent DNA helicase PcrA
MMGLGSGKRGDKVRDQLDKVKAVVRRDFAASCRQVERIVGEALPKQAPSRERAEWLSLVEAVITLALSCASLEELETKIAQQSRSLRNPPGDAVVLSTIHSAKGLEWDAVFLAGLEDGVLPHSNSEDIEEERRIAYVGVTRARRLLGLTYAAERYGEHARPSPFLFELTGKEERLYPWTGPKLKGADERLPLAGAADRQRQPGEDGRQSRRRRR